MSWSVSIPKGTRAEVATAVVNAELPADSYNKPELVEQWHVQLEAAKDAAVAILERAGFGEGGTFTVSMSGHAAHDGLAESTGYTTSEFVSVNVYREPEGK